MSDTQNSYDKNLKGKKRFCLLPLFPCLFAIIWAVVFTFGIWKEISLGTVNLLILPCYFIELAFGFIETNNRKKAILFSAALLNSLIITGLNLQNEFQLNEAILLSGLSGWSWICLLLALVASISVVAVLVRLLRWSQEQWEKVRKLCQESQMKSLDFWIEYISKVNTHRLAVQELKHKYNEQAEENMREKSNKRQEIKYQNRIEKLEAKIKERKEKRECRRNEKTSTKGGNFGKNSRFMNLFSSLKDMIVLGIAVVGFFWIPYASKLQSGVYGWIDSVKVLAQSFKGADSIENGQQALLYYFFLYVVMAVSAFLLIYLIFRMVCRKRDRNRGDEYNFLDTYQEPIAILLVFGAFFFVLIDEKANFFEVSAGWEILLLIILFILVAITAIEIVRIVLEQCANPNTLLKKIIYLIFVVVLKFLSELLLGVITSFRIQMFISSVLELGFPKTKDALLDKMQSKLNELFHGAVMSFSEDDTSAPKEFRRRRIWRRYRK